MTPADPIPPDRIVRLPRSTLRIGIGAMIVLALLGVAVAVLVSAFGAAGISRTVPGGVTDPGGGSPAISGPAVPGDSSLDGTAANDASVNGAGVDDAAAGGAVILVHLLGAVQQPGLYELREGDRIVDAVAAAGGFSDGADQGVLNLARRLTDGEQLYVPAVGETPPSGAAAEGTPGGTGTGRVDLNTADAAELDTLPGVGPATAKAILDWREENGRFTAVEDLLSVSGIGDKTFADLEDLVTV